MKNSLESYLDAAELQLNRLNEDHYIDFFSCGRDPSMDRWFTETASKWQAEDLCAVWVLSPAKNNSDPLGFFTLSAHQLTPANLNKNARTADSANKSWLNGLEQPFPAQLLGKFALGAEQQGSGLSSVLMTCVYAKHMEASNAVGAKFLVLDIQNQMLLNYYQSRFGFQRSNRPGSLIQLYRPTSIIREELQEILNR